MAGARRLGRRVVAWFGLTCLSVGAMAGLYLGVLALMPGGILGNNAVVRGWYIRERILSRETSASDRIDAMLVAAGSHDLDTQRELNGAFARLLEDSSDDVDVRGEAAMLLDPVGGESERVFAALARVAADPRDDVTVRRSCLAKLVYGYPSKRREVQRVIDSIRSESDSGFAGIARGSIDAFDERGRR